MSRQFRFTKLQATVESDLSEVLGEAIPMTFIGCGIVNPMGPTLNLLAADRVGQSGEQSNLYRLMLNPFTQTCDRVGTVAFGDEWSPSNDLAPFFGPDWGTCPALLLPPGFCSSDTLHDLFQAFLQTFSDGDEAWRNVKAHPGDPWSRVKEEMSDATSMIQRLRKTLGGTTPRPLTHEEAGDMARLQLNPTNLSEELKAFLFAWNGAQQFTGLKGMPQKDFIHILIKFGMTCRIPGIPNIFDQHDTQPD
jgi:hypothetical protein